MATSAATEKSSYAQQLQGLAERWSSMRPELATLERAFHSLADPSTGTVSRRTLLDALADSGIHKKDCRVQKVLLELDCLPDPEQISSKEFSAIVQHNVFLAEKALTGNLVIPDFQSFTEDITRIFDETKGITRGKVADYIPQLKRVPADKYAVSICTVDGQRFSLGDASDRFVVQSTCKPINYCLALECAGDLEVHKHVGREPSGRGFNELTLNSEGLPHNPMINAGAIMTCSMIRPELNIADRFEYVLDRWQDLAGDMRPGFNNSVYLSERQTADRNFALGYFMRENNAFPLNTDLLETLEFYFQCCSIELDSQSMATVAATLANAGICPSTGKKVLRIGTVKNCLSLMYSCGMYDFSGEFAFTMGIPAKSGVSGALLIVVPNVMGIAVWSPPLDALGNSKKGLEFCKRLIDTFNFHSYDSFVQHPNKKDPRLKKNQEKLDTVGPLIWGASQGDINEMRRLIASGVDLNAADYDGRTALHLASAEGQVEMTEFLLTQGANAALKDRWGYTPLDDARRGKHPAVIKLLEQHGAPRGRQQSSSHKSASKGDRKCRALSNTSGLMEQNPLRNSDPNHG